MKKENEKIMISEEEKTAIVNRLLHKGHEFTKIEHWGEATSCSCPKCSRSFIMHHGISPYYIPTLADFRKKFNEVCIPNPGRKEHYYVV